MRLIAFYLPQFHTIPENDMWWGAGFTEWTNVKNAKQLFEWQYQPRVPLGGRYYDLDGGFKETMEWQISLAKEHGIFGFCFYHYWFKGGKRLLEKPVERFLLDKSLDLPFCLSWANEPWTRAWDGGVKDVIMPQEYGNEDDWAIHFDYLLPFFKDDRYIRYADKPLLLIYRPELIPRLGEMLQFWDRMAKEHSFQGLHFVAQGTEYGTTQRKDEWISDFILYEPGYTQAEYSLRRGYAITRFFENPSLFAKVQLTKLKKIASRIIPIKNVNLTTTILDYDDFWKHILNRKYGEHMIPGAFVDWDNSPRRGQFGARIFRGASPVKYCAYMTSLIKKAKDQSSFDMIFIDAWNEWAEGAHLEPDEKNGYGYLEATKKAMIDAGESFV